MFFLRFCKFELIENSAESRNNFWFGEGGNLSSDVRARKYMVNTKISNVNRQKSNKKNTTHLRRCRR